VDHGVGCNSKTVSRPEFGHLQRNFHWKSDSQKRLPLFCRHLVQLVGPICRSIFRASLTFPVHRIGLAIQGVEPQ
jgi:hypothetical protein